MKLKLLLLISLILLSSCSLFRPEIVVQTKLAYLRVICPTPPPPSSVRMLKVEPRAVFDIDGIAWVGLTPGHYANLGINFQDIIRYLKAQKGQTKYWRDCILDFNAEVQRLQGLEETD